MGLCNCPQSTSLTTIPSSDCPFNIKQIQKIAFQRKGYSFVAPTNDIKLLASWTPLLVAVGVTKVVVSPFIGGDPIITPGEMKVEGGGDNSTLNGVEIVTGTDPSVFTCNFKGLTPAQEAALKTLLCENELDAYFLTENDKIVAKKNATDDYSGIRVYSVYTGDRNNQGFGTSDMNAFKFSMKAGWSETIDIVTPTDFSPLTDL